MNHLHPILAAGTAEILVFLVIGGISFISWLAKKAAKAKEERAAQQKRLRMEQTGESQGASLDDIAMRRRRELEALANRQASTPRTQPSQPNNLTMEQLRQRAQAKIAYEQRAAALARQEAARRAQMARASVAAPPPRPQQSSPQQQRQAQQLQRQAQLARQRLAQQQAQARAAQPPTPPTVAAPLSVQQSHLGEGATHVDTSNQQIAYTGESVTQRHVTDAVMAGLPATPSKARIPAKSLRQAIVLQEILSKPLALRE